VGFFEILDPQLHPLSVGTGVQDRTKYQQKNTKMPLWGKSRDEKARVKKPMRLLWMDTEMGPTRHKLPLPPFPEKKRPAAGMWFHHDIEN